MSQAIRKDAAYIIKASLLFCALSAAFSLAGVLLPEKGPLHNPVGGINLHEIGGHLLWGLAVGAVFMSARYAITTGFFAVLIDSDHAIALFHVDALARMAHSFAFAAIAVAVLMISLGKRDYRLGAAAFAGVLSHISFDIFAGGDSKFPLFTPFYNHAVTFPTADWVYFEAAAAAVAGIIVIISSKRRLERARAA